MTTGFFVDAPIKVKVKVKAHTSRRPKTAGAYYGFISMKHLEVLLLPPDGMLVHRRVSPEQFVASTHLYTWAQLFKSRLAFNPGLNLTLVSFSCVQKHFLG